MKLSFVYRHRHALIGILGLSIVSAILLFPFQFSAKAAKGLALRTKSHDAELPNYDIRLDKAAAEKIASFRDRQGKSAMQIADARDALARGEQDLRKRVPSLKV